ncbi:LysR substrate-binding domain-containing protein [Alloyangia pacifica]|uniref:LysR family transcriptional regulator, glycine cleavage system transcriptional activator n=1 Tax=Alloyangia pacifica TaxID=311180 RepID=A0A1I6UQ30_9RHOB|nr:LysR substrate-binding domain-containing protein [Alloyangia pacifica]SDH78028.1 LysR family transcriptional regulator, glycine cleavage system transcriptional activator [Alloyangia pacifica]SFT03576.1 LysR family transcriptional regulator, glycine cleavage system transcriptional activator [Alloyangia pacifica]
MSTRSVRLPPLNSLRVFSSVMKHGSFRAAADELLVTPQAVSQQIKLLEDMLQVELFQRKGRVIEPTEQAILFSHFVRAGFDEFIEGVRRVTNATYRNRININVSPYFATRYLMARLEHFRERMPGADLRLTTMIELPDFAADEVDASIQWGFGRWKDFDVTLLVHDPKIICCAPELAETVKTPADLVNHTLLHPVLARSHWQRVLSHLGIPSREAAGEIEFQDAATMRRGTISGLGIGLVSRIDALSDLDAGKLVAPLGLDILADMPEADIPGFYLVLPKAHRRVKTIAAFCDWITSEDWAALLDAE